MKITPSAQGIFYPETKELLLSSLNQYKAEICNRETNLIIVPHAGLEYSGQLAFQAYNLIEKDTKDFVIIAPAIYSRIYGCVTCNEEAFETPLGDIKIKPAELEINNSIFECESSLTVQLPIIKYIFPEAAVTPVIYGCEDYKNIAEIIQKYIENNAVIIASNLSRFVPERESVKLDGQTARMIERKQTQDFDNELADGAAGICAAIEYAKENNMDFIQIGLTNSSKVNEDTSSVVGYGAWALIQQLAVE